jgi:aconitate hydratase
MINGIGVLGWGVGGIEAEAAMLGQPINLLLPRVVGVRLSGEPGPGITATDIVLTLTHLLRDEGVVGKFVEFFGEGLDHVGLETRATIANMSPEFGSTCAIFPVDAATLSYLRLTGRTEAHCRRVEDYFRAQELFRIDTTKDPTFSATLELDLSSVEPTISGPKRPQDRTLLSNSKAAWQKTLRELTQTGPSEPLPSRPIECVDG